MQIRSDPRIEVEIFGQFSGGEGAITSYIKAIIH